jgi:hypothetical protein
MRQRSLDNAHGASQHYSFVVNAYIMIYLYCPENERSAEHES